MSETIQTPPTVTATTGVIMAAQPQPPGFFERAVEHILPGHDPATTPAPAPVSGEVLAALRDHAAGVLGLVQAILQAEADHSGMAGLPDLSRQALPIAEGITKILGAALGA